MDTKYTAPQTDHSPIDKDAEEWYSKGEILVTTVYSFVLDFVESRPEAVVWDAWHMTTHYFFIQEPAANEKRNERMMKYM